MADISDNYPDTNVFGKMRGHYDIMMAARKQRSLEQEFVALFAAVPPERKQSLISAFNQHNLPEGAEPGFMITPVQPLNRSPT